ncbi:hypothetical protein F5878DRAFT_646900 [Lentinula raphanica]|uniref:Secreted protein n=1 Tax=Lentinula raphanica TaxID=153919 RepID=A0AA38NX75_9AGAR|nr:hypothetical protein F5878DRAFT_646900 [Lentinula raphanica]
MHCIQAFVLLGVFVATLPPLSRADQQLATITHTVIYEYFPTFDPKRPTSDWDSDDNRDLSTEAHEWSKEFIEERVFKQALGLTAKLYEHPEGGPPQDMSLVVIHGGREMPALTPANLPIEQHFLSKTSLRSLVSVYVGDKWALLVFHGRTINPSDNPTLVIPLNDKDRDFLKRCDDYIKSCKR